MFGKPWSLVTLEWTSCNDISGVVSAVSVECEGGVRNLVAPKYFKVASVDGIFAQCDFYGGIL